jgi:hypothetical protein
LTWLTLAFACCLAPGAVAESDLTITAIEEDWEIEIGTPAADQISPQIFVVNTPTGNLNGAHAVFEINNLNLPDFYGGGLQFQGWVGEDPFAECHHDSFGALWHEGEVVTFTTSMRATDGIMHFQVANGNSETWGTFGEGNSLRIVAGGQAESFAEYSPEASVHFSRVGFGGNRVKRFVLKKVRYYHQQTLVATDDTERDVLNKPE